MTGIEPQNVTIEMQVLGAIMLEPDTLELAASILTANDFYLDGHRLMYQMMLDLSRQGHPPDYNIVIDALAKRDQLRVVGGAGVVMGLLNSVPTAATLEHHARKIKEKSLLRQVIHVCEQAKRLCYAEQHTAEEVLFTLSGDVDAIAEGTASDAEIQTVEAMAQQVALDLIQQFNSGDQTQGATIGWPKLDRLCGGYQRGDLVIWAAPTNIGKSKMLCYSLIQTALAGNRAGLISIDMNRRRLAKYLLPPILTLTDRVADPSRIFEPYAWNEEGQALIRDECFSVDLGGRLMLVPKPRSTSLLAIEGYVRKLARMGCSVVAIDQAQNFSEFRADEHGGIATIVGQVKHWAWHYNVCIVLVHQVGREGYSGRFNLRHLQGSSAFEQYSDTVIAFSDPQQRMLDLYGSYIDEGQGRLRKPEAKDYTPENEGAIRYDVANPRPVEINLAKSREDRKQVLETRFDYRLGVVV